MVQFNESYMHIEEYYCDGTTIQADANKQIAAFLFLWFMERNGILYNPDGSKRIDNNTLVTLTLMIAENLTPHDRSS